MIITKNSQVKEKRFHVATVCSRGNLSNQASRNSSQSIHQSRGHGNHSRKMSINLELVLVQFAISRYPTLPEMFKQPGHLQHAVTMGNQTPSALNDSKISGTRQHVMYIIGPSGNVFSSKLAVPHMRSCKSVVSGKDPPWLYNSGWCSAEEGTCIFPFYNTAHDRRLYIRVQPNSIVTIKTRTIPTRTMINMSVISSESCSQKS